MLPRDELHVVFGTGPVGLAVMRELLGQGKRVRLVNRSGTAAALESVEIVKGKTPRQMMLEKGGQSTWAKKRVFS